MNEKYRLTEFTAGATREHEGITYKAVHQERGEFCRGCAFFNRGEPCKSPRGWLCVEVIEGEPNGLIFKIIE